jgi:hypothetical protein
LLISSVVNEFHPQQPNTSILIEKLFLPHYINVTRSLVAVLSDMARVERALSSQAVVYGRSEAKQQAVTPYGHDSG